MPGPSLIQERPTFRKDPDRTQRYRVQPAGPGVEDKAKSCLAYSSEDTGHAGLSGGHKEDVLSLQGWTPKPSSPSPGKEPGELCPAQLVSTSPPVPGYHLPHDLRSIFTPQDLSGEQSQRFLLK